MIWNIALVGAGTVGQALLELLYEKRDYLKKAYGFEYRICCISARSKGTLSNPEGLNERDILSALREEKSLLQFPQYSFCFSDLLSESQANILVESTPTNLETGEPALEHITTALNQKIHVTTVNKGPIALAYDPLCALAEEKGVQLRYEGTVMSGTPIIDMARHGLAGAKITKVEGILNGTTNYMLTRMEDGVRYSDALEEAQKLGYAEADPSGDVDGWDTAIKVTILGKVLFNKDLPVKTIKRTGISNITPEDIENARGKNAHIRLVATIESNGHASVAPLMLPKAHPLSQIRGVTNAACLTTDTLGPVTLIGAGAGGKETAQGLLTDILNIACKL